MIAMLWAQQIMLGKKTYAEVPRLLKAKVPEWENWQRKNDETADNK